jgi:cyclophilin family peptidyl-prolyl cis-trans isomerase
MLPAAPRGAFRSVTGAHAARRGLGAFGARGALGSLAALGILAAGAMLPLAAAPVAPAPEVFRARFETSQGSFVVEARRAWAPRGVDRFFALVAAGFFDDSRFFRVVPGYIAQFGIPGNPAVTALWSGRTIPDDPVRESNRRGSVAYAMTGPDTRATQLYVNLADNSRLDSQGFAPIGRVVAGMDVVDRLYGGYGETAGGGMRGGRQGKILAGGNTHLDAEFPKLDRLLRARLLDGPPAPDPR